MPEALALDTETALAQRLAAAADVLLGPGWDDAGPVTAASTLERLVRLVRSTLDHEQIWLLYVAVSATLPTPDTVITATRHFELTDDVGATLWLLDNGLAAMRRHSSAGLTLELVRDAVVVETDFSARHDLHTGIQRVVRATMPLWRRDHDITPVAWTDTHGGLRRLSDNEERRLLHWGRLPAGSSPSAPPSTLVVPWHSVVALVEVPARTTCPQLTALAQFTSNRVVAIGYDCIPVVSADLVPMVEPSRFVHYLEVIKHCRRVAGISVSAAAEFQGFAQMLPAQGLPGPTVVECALPVDTSGADVSTPIPDSDEPVVLCVGSIEPRKNQLAVLHAAEVLWREGLRFQLRFIGGGGWGHAFGRRLRQLRSAGRSVRSETAISEARLADAYRQARFTVFASVHEGYGLPVAESLAFGVPAITTSYGSTREIGAGGGVDLVDPRSDEDLIRAMRRLLVDDAHLARLHAEIGRRPRRTWEDYAAELWTALVASELQSLEAERVGVPA
jgi:glycosyltransferase involved in cell wall biosynthesis